MSWVEALHVKASNQHMPVGQFSSSTADFRASLQASQFGDTVVVGAEGQAM